MPDHVDHLAVLSVGHPATFRAGGFEQYQKSWYMLLFQFKGIAERWLSSNDWANFRAWARHPDADAVIAELEADGSLTPGAELLPRQRPAGVLAQPGRQLPPIQAPTMGVWSSGDVALTERQMTNSARERRRLRGATSGSTGQATGCSSRRPTRSTGC